MKLHFKIIAASLAFWCAAVAMVQAFPVTSAPVIEFLTRYFNFF